MNEQQAILVQRLKEAELSLNRFFEVKPDKAPAEGKGYTAHLRTPEEMDKAGVTRWGIMGGDFLVPIDTDIPEMGPIIRKILPRTFETLSVGRQLPHFYFLVWGKSGKQPPNGILHIPNDFDENGKKRGAGEIRVGNQYLVAPGTDVDYYNSKGVHIIGRYKILNDVPIAKLEYDTFMEALKPYRSENEKISLEEMKTGVGANFRHAKAMSYAYHLISVTRLGYDLALMELNRFGNACTPPLIDQDYFDRALKAAINLEAATQARIDDKKRTVQEWAKILYDGQELRTVEKIKVEVEQEDNLPNYDYFCPILDKRGTREPFKPAKVAKWLSEHRHFKADRTTDLLYFYDGQSWRDNGEVYLQEILGKILETENRHGIYTDVLHDLKALVYNDIKFSQKIALENGLLDVESQELLPFNFNEMPFHKLPITYNKDAKCPNWEAFISQVVNSDDLLTIQEWSGFLLLPDYRFHKLLWVHGEGRNGKGVWQRTMEAILGENNVSSIGLEEFNGGHRFALRQLYGKLFNPCSEPNTTYPLQTPLLKKATGQDTIEAEIKGKQNRLKFRNYAKITVLANKFPKVEDTTTAFKERRLFIKFPNEFTGTKQIQNIEANWLIVNDEKSGILNWMLKGLERLLTNGYFTESKTQQETEAEFLRASDTIGAFLKEMIVYNKNFVTTRSEAYESYKKYCDTIGLEAESEKAFTQRLKDTPKISVCSVKKPKQERAWKGITLKLISDDGEITEDKSKIDNFTPEKDTADTQDTPIAHCPTSNDVTNKQVVEGVSRVSSVSESELKGYTQLVCVFCQKGIMDNDWKQDDFTWDKPAHKKCYDTKKSELAAQDDKEVS